MEWRIYYGDRVVTGSSRADWAAAPDEGVQVVALMEPPRTLRWSCDGVPVRDRQLWTGNDEYDPWGWGVKTGAWLPDEEYEIVWTRACTD